jgi:hypothetical protein
LLTYLIVLSFTIKREHLQGAVLLSYLCILILLGHIRAEGFLCRILIKHARSPPESVQHGGLTPQQIHEVVVNNSNPRESSLGLATLVIPMKNPAHQGMIYAIHSVVRFAMFWFGQLALQWENRIFGSISKARYN